MQPQVSTAQIGTSSIKQWRCDKVEGIPC